MGAGIRRIGTARVLGLGAVAVALAIVVVGAAVTTNALGAGDRFAGLVRRIDRIFDPVPVRSSVPTVVITAPPSVVPTATPSSTPVWSAAASASGGATPPPTPSPTPARVPVDVNLLSNPARWFASEDQKDLCAAAGVQMVLAIHGHGDTSKRFQDQIAARVGEWESYDDSHNGDWGPSAMAEALAAYGVPGYQVRAYDRRDDALRGAAVALSQTHAPVILLAWRGAHTWVMTGYRADADPTIFPDATVSGTYILDPWYPRISSIWGPSDPPGTFQDAAEMVRNYLPWKRPEGRYPDRDGRWILVAPTVAITPPG